LRGECIIQTSVSHQSLVLGRAVIVGGLTGKGNSSRLSS
jgi:hypothetical protein